MLAVRIDGPRHERGLGAKGQRNRVERVIQRAHRCRLGDLAELRSGGVLALRQPVDPIVEQQDCQVDVASQYVDQMVAADRQRVAITGDTNTATSSLAVATPVAMAVARPWIECKPYDST